MTQPATSSELAQNYRVNYSINVQADEGVKKVTKFAEAIGELVKANAGFKLAAGNISTIMKEVDEVFRPKGRKRDYTYDFNIKTNQTEEKLTRIKTALTEIREMSSGINLVINAGQKLDTKAIKSQAKKVIDKNAIAAQETLAQKTAKDSALSISETQKNITKAIGKINSALIHLENEREIRIKTDTAKLRLEEILTLLHNIKGASQITLNIQNGKSKKGKENSIVPEVIPTVPAIIPGSVPTISVPPVLPPVVPPTSPTPEKPLTQKQQERQRERQAKEEERIVRKAEAEQEREFRQRIRNKLKSFNNLEKIYAKRDKKFEELEKMRMRRILEKEREDEKKKLQNEKRQQKLAGQRLRLTQKQSVIEDSKYGNRRRAAINRMQYSKTPSIRNLPFLSMFNAYMAYNFMKSELRDAVEYANVMESAKSILRVSDSDLGTFEQRFEKMSRHVRQIGVDTKFTAVQIGQATRFLAMAGMDMETIHNSMRPIVNLALIGDNDVGQIADLTTNIMSGYKIKSTSMNSVADILASTVSRSNVNIIEMAESFKMAGGYLKTAGIDFAEAAAAVGVLGNSGIKGTMAGTALRAMSTRFAKPTKEAAETLEKLKVKFTHFIDVYGKKVEKVRPLADIFRDLHKAGATMADMQAIFGKIGGNAAMQFINNYEKLREITVQNKGSNGISTELALVKQQTTKGLWYQVTSQLTESFMTGFELMEPSIRQALKDFLAKFSTPDLARGLAEIGRTLISIVSTLANFGTWIVKNFHWIEPILFTGFVATRLYKLAGALTNVGVAMGFLGKQSAAASTIQLLTGLTGLGGKISGKTLTFANKRAIVSALQSAGVTGKGAMTQALLSSGLMGGSSLMAARSAFGPLFASQVVTGNGMVGATASLSAIGTGAAAATASIAALVGALGWVAYKTWKIKEAKDAVQEEIRANRKYRYPSIDSLYESLRKTYQQALATKNAVDDVTKGKTLEEASGQKIGAFTGNWWTAFFTSAAAAETRSAPSYSFDDAYQSDVRAAIHTLAEKDSQERILKAYANLGKLKTDEEIGGFIRSAKAVFGQDGLTLNRKLWTEDKNGKILYKSGMDKLTAAEASSTIDYADYMNEKLVPEIVKIAQNYRTALSSQHNARYAMALGGFKFTELIKLGYSRGKDGLWKQKVPGKKATKEEREIALANASAAHNMVVTFASSLRQTFGGSAEMAENILQKAGFSPDLYSNEPDKDDSPYNSNGITSGADDGLAGGNYSGTGKLSSAAPKQVIVNITNLMSLEAINLLKSEDGKNPEIQNLKEQLAQALIDVVHDFDATWEG